MKILKNILTHLSLISSVMLIVPLVIDMFFNNAMGFVDNTLYKSIFMAMLICCASSSALHIYGKTKNRRNR